jgi:uncharacterized SAM-binding protein YcdF (DUF218 family)
MNIVIWLAVLAAVRLLWQLLHIRRNRQLARVWTALDIDAILVLGGDEERERVTAELAAGCKPSRVSAGVPSERHRMAGCAFTSSAKRILRTISRYQYVLSDQRVPMYISSGHGNVGEVFAAEGVPPCRVKIDTRATDTVTNFTTMLPGLNQRDLRHILVVTSDYHMGRAGPVAQLALEGCGLACSLCSLPSTCRTGASAESAARKWRDVVRIKLWLLTGLELSFLGRLTHPERFWHVPVSAFSDL